ncbi:hypothetical protein NUW54_g7245 [Trametes sanguinea]|uniref:Uncharacterized protein n=1 Tax=Trametes sanguinea TaxID=158606 RepID=A0ACC1PNT5_9APHY|nr:hypothetical protein NUW54_g7245 [Trametes sanguinea]
MPSAQPVSSPAPQASTKPLNSETSAIVDFAELRQLTLENGRIIDLPISILTGPAPKPTEFLHLQHYFEGRRGAPVNIAECDDADQAIDLLADEIEAIRLLLYGYAVNFKRYVERFEDAHAMLRREIDSVGESYKGLVKLVAPAQNAALEVEAKLVELEQRLARLPPGGGPRPPKFKKSRRGGLANPPLSKEENEFMRSRQGFHSEERSAIGAVIGAGRELEDAAILKEVMEPPRANPQPNGSSKAKTARQSQPLTHALNVKIKKVVENVQQARELLQSAQVVTTNNLAVLRYREDEVYAQVRELWKWHDATESLAMTAGKVSQLNEGRISAYNKWASTCEEHAAATQADQSRTRSGSDYEGGSDPAQSSNAATPTSPASTKRDGPKSPVKEATGRRAAAGAKDARVCAAVQDGSRDGGEKADAYDGPRERARHGPRIPMPAQNLNPEISSSSSSEPESSSEEEVLADEQDEEFDVNGEADDSMEVNDDEFDP